MTQYKMKEVIEQPNGQTDWILTSTDGNTEIRLNGVFMILPEPEMPSEYADFGDVKPMTLDFSVQYDGGQVNCPRTPDALPHLLSSNKPAFSFELKDDDQQPVHQALKDWADMVNPPKRPRA